VGNPDEMKSNRMLTTLERLKFRVTAPEPGIPEAIDGAVITALNEETIASAALGNKGGLNIIVTYEAFAAKMHGVIRQEIIFADHQNAMGAPPGWLSVPLVLTSHTWENAKNEQSHQDPAMAELMLAEPSDVSRVLFPVDANSAAAVIEAVYATHGQIWTVVAPKAATIPDLMTESEARALVRDGALRLDWAGHDPDRARVILTAVGAYQLVEVLRASERLTARGIAHAVVAMLEPGRFRAARGARERRHTVPDEVRARLYPDGVPARLFLTHTRPEPLLGTVRPLDSGPETAALGFRNHGGTLSVGGMLHVNRATWAHCLEAVAPLLRIDRSVLLSPEEMAALDGERAPEGIIF